LRRSSDPVVIVGGGLTGLSAALALGNREYRLIERETEVGGLCRSYRSEGYTFDYTGHLLHMRRPEIRSLVYELAGEKSFVAIDRRSGVHSHGVITDYPFQVNTHGLPLPVVRECVMGFAETLQSRVDLGDDPDFRSWALATFGEGICRHFMIPYNAKLFRTDLSTVSADWVSWSIPKPGWADVVRGALGRTTKAFGYNPSFLYPAGGGIDHLPRAFLPRLRNLTLSTAVVRIDAGRREVDLSNGERIRYSSLISTMPLPVLLECMTDAPAELREGARALRHVSVWNLNLGFSGPCPLPHHWLYFPEPEFPFYRVGVYSNLCPAAVPPGHSAFYVEISHRPGEKPPRELERDVEAALRRVGLVPPDARRSAVKIFDIEHAYVIHDRHRRQFVPEATRHLERLGIISVGRYGSWEYSAMEDALWHGREAARLAAA